MQLIYNLRNNGTVRCRCLTIELLEIMEQWRTRPKLKMVTFNILITNLLEVMLLHRSKNWGSVTNRATEEDDDDVVDWNQEHCPPVCLFLRRCRTGRDTITSRLSATKEAPLVSGTSLLHIEMEPSLWLGFAILHRRKILRQVHGRLLLSLCQRPI